MPNNPAYPIGYKIYRFRQARRLLLATSQAAGALWGFRWGTTAGHQCYINRVTLKGTQIAAASAEELRFNLKVARGFTAADSANVASILRSGDNQKLNGDYGDSVLTAFVESNAAGAASGGTYTQDTDPITLGSYVTTAAAGVQGGHSVIFDYDPIPEDLPALRFEQNEGFVINLEVTKGATQGFVLDLEVEWAEAIKPA